MSKSRRSGRRSAGMVTYFHRAQRSCAAASAASAVSFSVGGWRLPLLTLLLPLMAASMPAAAGAADAVATSAAGAQPRSTPSNPAKTVVDTPGKPASGAAARSAASIRNFSPQGEVRHVRQVKVGFSQDMTVFGTAPAGSAAAPFDVSCANTPVGGAAALAGASLPGAGRWLDARNFVYDFESDLPPGVRCVFAAKGDLRTVDGAALSGKTSYQFNTGGPAVLKIAPESWQPLDEEQMFVLIQNGPATDASVLAHAYCAVDGVGERIPVRLVGGADRLALLKEHAEKFDPARVSTLQCQQRLSNGAAMQLVWDRGISTPSGIASSVVQRFKFDVRKAFVASLSCERENAKAACSPLSTLRLSFNAPVARKLAQEILFVGIDGRKRKASLAAAEGSAEVDAVSFAPPLPANGMFSIELPRDFRDADGRALENAAAFPLRARLADYPPLAKFAAAPFGILELNADPVLPVTLRHVEPALLVRSADGSRSPGALASLRVQDDAAIIAWIARLGLFHESRIEVGKLPKAGSPGAPVVPAAAIDKGWIETRAVGLLANEAAAQRRPLPAGPGEAAVASGSKAAASAGAAPGPASAPSRPFEVVGIPFATPGFHVLEIESAALGASLLQRPLPMYVRTSVLVTNLAVHLRLGRENGAVWVTTLDTASPVANADVRVSDCNGRLLWRGNTGADGVARLPQALARDCQATDADKRGQLNGLFVSARATDAKGRPDMAFVLSSWNDGIESYRFNLPTDTSADRTSRVHTVFDRTLLRAGETVSMKHFMRLENLQGFALAGPARLPTRLHIVHQGSNEEFRLPLVWNGRASALSSFTIPKQAKLGTYTVTLDNGPLDETSAGVADDAGDGSNSYESGSFRVEEFRLPLMSGRITPPKGVLVSPKQLPLALQLNFLNGGGAAGQAVTLTSLLRKQSPSWPGQEEFSFQSAGANAGESGEGSQEAADDEQKIVADKLAVRLDANGAGQVVLQSLPAVRTPMVLQNEMSYADPNGEIQTVSQTLKLWPSAVVVGVKTGEWVAARRTLALTAVTLDTNGRALPNVHVDLLGTAVQNNSFRKRLVGGFYGYENQRVDKSLGKLCSGTSDAHGLLRCEVSLQESGNIEVTARASDQSGKLATAMTSAWLTQNGETWFEQQNQDRIEVLPEKKHYEAGETAVFQVRMPFRQATVLLAVEREGIIETRVINLSGRDPVIRLPVKAAYGPNVYVSVLAVRARVREVPWYSFFSWGWKQPLAWWGDYRDSAAAGAPGATVDLAKPAFKFGIAEIAVGGNAHKLDVRVTADKATYPVRATARVNVLVKLPDGRPAAGAHIALAAVDEALLELQPNRSWDLLDAMLKRRAYGMETATAQMQVIGKRHFGRKAVPVGGGGGRAPTRELFDTLLLWRGDIVLDTRGRADIDVPLNDSLSSFRLVAVADDGPGLFGHGMSSVRTSQDLQLISGLPPLVREGDQYTAMATLRNTTARAMEVDFTARVSGPDAGALAQAPSQHLSLAAGEVRELSWPVVAPALVQAPAPPPAGAPGGPAATAGAAGAGLAAAPARNGAGAVGAALKTAGSGAATAPSNSGQLSWEITAQERQGGQAGAPAAVRDAIRVSQRLIAAVPVTVRQATLFQLERSAVTPVAAPEGALAGRGGVSVTLTPTLAGGLAGVQAWFAAYPYSCLEQRASRAIGLRDPAAWARLMEDLPGYLDSDGLADFYPLGPNPGAAQGSDVLTAYLLSAAQESAYQIPQASRERMLRGLAAFVEGRIVRDHWAPQKDLDVRKLAALDALARHGQAQARMLGSIQLAPNLWPTSGLLDWMSLLARLEGIPDAQARLAEADNILRARLSFQGTRTVFSTEDDDGWWWTMTGPEVNASRVILTVLDRPAWQDDLPKLASGTIGRQVRGHWSTTTANLWGSLALEKFSARFEKTPVVGVTTAGLGRASNAAANAGASRSTGTNAAVASASRAGAAAVTASGAGAVPPAGATGKSAPAAAAAGDRSYSWPAGNAGKVSWQFPWPAGAVQALGITHAGAGRPWVTLQSLAAVPLKDALASGYRLRRSMQIEGKTGSAYARGDIVRVEVEIDATADMTDVVVSDPLPAGATVLGSGLGRDAAIGAAAGAAAGQPSVRAAAFEERAFDSFRSYYKYVPKGRLIMRYRLRLNNAGVFRLPPSRVEAMYAPEMFGEAPNPALTVK